MSNIRKKPEDPYMSLLNNSRQLEQMKGNIRIYQEKYKVAKRKYDIKKKKMQKYHGMLEMQKKQQEERRKQEMSVEKYRGNAKVQTVNSLHASSKLDSTSRSFIIKGSSSQKERFQSLKKNQAMERRLCKKNNEQRKALQELQQLNNKKQIRQSIGEFEKSVPLKKQQFLHNYLQKIKSQQNARELEFNNESRKQVKSMKKLIREKSTLVRSIDQFKQEEDQLYDKYMRIVGVRNSHILDCMMKSVIVE